MRVKRKYSICASLPSYLKFPYVNLPWLSFSQCTFLSLINMNSWEWCINKIFSLRSEDAHLSYLYVKLECELHGLFIQCISYFNSLIKIYIKCSNRCIVKFSVLALFEYTSFLLCFFFVWVSETRANLVAKRREVFRLNKNLGLQKHI